MILLFGSIYGNEASETYMGKGMVDVSVPAYFALILSVTAFMSVPMTLSEYREKKILKRYIATPLNKSKVLISIFSINLITTLFGMILLFITAKIKYNVKFEGNPLIFASMLILSITTMYLIGLLLSNIGRNIKNTNTLCYCVFFPMLFLSGATIPKEIFPSSISKISKIVPLGYVVDVLKASWLGNGINSYLNGILFLVIALVICFMFNCILFKWD